MREELLGRVAAGLAESSRGGGGSCGLAGRPPAGELLDDPVRSWSHFGGELGEGGPVGCGGQANAADSAAQSLGLFFSMSPTRVAPIRWTRRRTEECGCPMAVGTARRAPDNDDSMGGYLGWR